mmetsp:Transcript_3006/g.9201  ORF Transcript_3006/g.9201 Transcript_3006/m.9201 type:complete len:274 (-) Transcript_3006:40-861(-)
MFRAAFAGAGGRTGVLGRRSAVCVRDASRPLVALTREAGKNSKLAELLRSKNIDAEELPCVESAEGEDLHRLPRALQKKWDWIVVTSPEAANVFLRSLAKVSPGAELRVAAVGNATAEVLRQGGVSVAFTPSRATADDLCREIPGESCSVLYPASALASGELEKNMGARGFEVLRLNTYTTRPATWDSDQLARSRNVDIVAVGSPSALRAWIAQTGAPPRTAACIGSTSARASREEGVESVFYSENPGVAGWANSVEDAVRFLQRQHEPLQDR